MAIIYVDNQEYKVRDGTNLLNASLSAGLDIPYFCWHPALGSVGACRLCAVKQFKDEEDTKGKLVMACMTLVNDGTRISIKDEEARGFRKAVIEWLMVNHPHDCPVCDEGGECHLQDMTLMTGHAYREFRFRKRTYRNQYLGPLVNHEMNRCIQCYRCVRFYNDYAGGNDLKAMAAHDHVYFGRHKDGVLESEFSGNLVEVCPTGVFTDKTLKQHYTRKWDLQTAPSVCVHCGVGCNTIPGERYGSLRRIRNRYNGEVNRYFLCDRGRYGYEFVNSDRRIHQAMLRRKNGEVEIAYKDEAVRSLSSTLANGSGAIGIGSPRASLEANFALRRLVGPENFYAGIPERQRQLIAAMLDILQSGPARSPSLHDIQQADAVLVLGEDLTNTAPMIALALRQAARQQPRQAAHDLDIPDWEDAAVREVIQRDTGPVFIATPNYTKLDEICQQIYRAAPDDIARLGFAVAGMLSEDAPSVSDLSEDLRSLAQTIAQALEEAERPLVIAGASLGSQAIVQAAANVAWALSSPDQPAGLSFIVPECNSFGLGLLGGGSLEAAFEALQSRNIETVIVLENDLCRQMPAPEINAALDKIKHLVVIDHLINGLTSKADLILPAATFAEADGTLVNNEGRAQRFYQVFTPAGDVQESWRWIAEIIRGGDYSQPPPWRNLDEIMADLAQAESIFQSIPEIAPPEGFRIAGQKIPRQPHRYSGRTAMLANITVHEPKPPEDPDAPLTFSMEGFQGQPPPSLVWEFWAPGWNSVQSVNKFQSEVGGPLHGGDPGRRLFEPAPSRNITYFDRIPAAFKSKAGNEWLVVPLYHIFGSEELSVLAPGIAELAPPPYLALHPEDAAGFRLEPEATVALKLDGAVYHLPIKPVPALPKGIAGLPVGLTVTLAGLPLPQWVEISG